MGDNVVVADRLKLLFQVGQKLHGSVCNPSAEDAAYMIVISCLRVKAFLVSPILQLVNCAALTEHLEIPIDRAQADMRKSAPNQFIQLAGRRMSGISLQLFQDNLALPRHLQSGR